MALVQKAIFPTSFLGNISQGTLFYDILDRENAFLAYKTTSLKTRKIYIFPKGLTDCFGPNMATFLTFF